VSDIYLGIDLGGTKMLAVLVDEEGTIIAKTRQETLAERGAEDTIHRLIIMAESLIQDGFPESSTKAVAGIGIAVAGILEPSQGKVVLATNLDWNNVPIGPILEDKFHCPVQVLNDANAAALGEWLVGAGKGTEDVVFVTISTGIGGGIISGGRLLLGSSNSAAEFGHISIDRHGPLCDCGNRGCIEVYSSGKSMARRVRTDAAEGGARTAAVLQFAGGDPEHLNAEHIASAAQHGDPYAKSVLTEAGHALGTGLVSIIHLINPKIVVLGGGVSEIGDLLFTPMLEMVHKYGIPGLVDNVRFSLADLGGEAGAVGAALWWRYERMLLVAPETVSVTLT
jgi:glucokinase